MNQPVNFNQQQALVSAPQESSEYKKQTNYKRRVIGKCYITFKIVKKSEDQAWYILKIDKINGVHVIEKAKDNNTIQLPTTNLLEQWEVEVRERINGSRDKVYFHPRSSKIIRSLTEVSKYIADNYYPNSSVKLQIRPKRRIPLNEMHFISANNSSNDESPATLMNEEIQSNDQEGMTEDEIQAAKILAYDLGKYAAFNVKVEPKD